MIAGGYEVDPALSHLAGPYGKINVGTAEEKQLMFDMMTARKAERVFVEMSGTPVAVACSRQLQHELRLTPPRLHAGVNG